MQEALPFRTWLPVTPAISRSSPAMIKEEEEQGGKKGGKECIKMMVSENAVIVFGRRGCCMCHVVKRLLLGLGVNPAVYEVADEDESGVIDELETIGGGGHGPMQFPAVFIGGRLFGGLERLMAAHISGELIPVLKQAGALWL